MSISLFNDGAPTRAAISREGKCRSRAMASSLILFMVGKATTFRPFALPSQSDAVGAIGFGRLFLRPPNVSSAANS